MAEQEPKHGRRAAPTGPSAAAAALPWTPAAPPGPDPDKAPIERMLEVVELPDLGPDIFTNRQPVRLAPGARGVFGGAIIALCLAAAQKTVEESFLMHSCHCYFLLPASAALPILFQVERVREGRSFATRTVQARQGGGCIFTVTASFVREGAEGRQSPGHAVALPEGLVAPSAEEEKDAEADDENEDFEDESEPSPIQRRGYPTTPGLKAAVRPEERRCRQWMRCRGRISEAGGVGAHINALAYLSDSRFIGTVSRVQGHWGWVAFSPQQVAMLSERRRKQVERLLQSEGFGEGPAEWATRRRVGMMVSLNHSIYFHEPRRIRADDWMLADMECPWSGRGRGVVLQRIFARDGTLLATCTQEGVVRLRPDEADEATAKARL